MEAVSPVPVPGLFSWVIVLALAGSGPAGMSALPAALLSAAFAAGPTPTPALRVTFLIDDPAPKPADDPTAPARNRMVDRHLVERGIKDPRVLEAFRTVPRHRFVPAEHRRLAYEDESLPIGEGQTITPTYDVAFMTEALQPKPTDRVFEVGTGSGYQAAILSRLVKDVYSVEIHQSLGERAAQVLKELGYDNVHTRVGDGYAGWPDAAPFDAVIVTCAPEKIPAPLVEQLKDGGRLLIPLGDRYNQAVWLFNKKDGKLDAGKKLKPTLFVPMTGRAQREAAEARPKQP